MANEITISVSLSVNKDSNVNGSATLSKDMAGAEMIGATQSLTTTAAAVNVGGCDQLKAILIKNMSTTESVHVGLDNTAISQRIATISPRNAIILDSPPSALYARTVSGTGDIWVAACED